MEDVISRNGLKSDLRKGKIDYSCKYDDSVTYQDIIEKDILDLMGFSTLTEAQKEDLHNKISSKLENRVAVQIFDRLSEVDRNSYDSLLIAEKNEEAYSFLKERGIIAEDILTTESLIMKLELYEDSKAVRGEANKILEQKQGVKNE